MKANSINSINASKQPVYPVPGQIAPNMTQSQFKQQQILKPDITAQKMAQIQKHLAVSKSATKQSKKNLLNYDSQDSVQMNPYLLEINKNNGQGVQNQSLYGNFNQNTNSSLSLNQSQSKNQHKKSESIDFLTQNLQYANGFNPASKQQRKRDHNKSIGAMPDSFGLHSDSQGLLSALEGPHNKHSMDSADLLNRNRINTLDHDHDQNRPSGLQ